MLDTSLKDQLKNIFAVLEAQYTLDIAVAPQHESRQELTEMLADVAECSDKIGKRTGILFTEKRRTHRHQIPGSPQRTRVHLPPTCHHECRREREEFSG